jgi:predicted RNase H-like HicB family nuclease
MTYTISYEQETDGRWIAEIEALPGVMAYGATRDEARTKVLALALRVLADRVEHGESIPDGATFTFTGAAV